MQTAERVAKILEMVVCPACHGRLMPQDVRGEQGFMRCVECRNQYPVEDGIPVLLVARAHS